MRSARSFYQLLRRGEDGQTLGEYALIMLLIAVVCVAGVTLFGNQLLNLYNQIVTGFP
jgi:Flp pilus assembly pilin Flp